MLKTREMNNEMEYVLVELDKKHSLFNGNIEARDDSIAVIDGRESVTLRPTIPNDTFDGTELDTVKWRKTICCVYPSFLQA